MKAFVFIESNTTGTGSLFIQKVIQRGFVPYFLTANKAKYPFIDDEQIICVSLDTTDVQAICEFVSALDGVAGVFSSSEYFIEIASEVARRVGLPTENTAAIRTCRDKKQLGEVLHANGIGTPRSQHLNLVGLTEAALGELPYPVVIKPRAGSGSVNVKLNCNAAEALRHCERMVRDGQIDALAQEYVEGSEYSVETITIHGQTTVLAVVQKHLGPEPQFVEIGHSYPSLLAARQRILIEESVTMALRAVDFKFGPAHTEIRVLGDEVTIIEINPRLAGGLIPVMLDEVFAADLLGAIIDLWTGAAGLPDFTEKRYAAIRFALPERAGRLQRPITLAPEVRDGAGVCYVHVMKQAGDELRLEGDFRDRIAAVICSGDDYAGVDAAARQALAALCVEIGPAGPAREQAAAAGLPQALQAIIYGGGPQADTLAAELGYLFDLNEAHLVMLGERGLIDPHVKRQLIAAHGALRHDDYAALRTLPRPRGLYMMLEQYLIDTLGAEVGGVLQTGRSRNDMNAAITQLKLRDAVGAVLDGLLQLRRSLVFKASREVEQAFPLYSQYQPALPGTLCHQLLAIEKALASECARLLHAIADIDVCPLGAGAGGGTTLPIDPELVAKLLGFSMPAANSIDAVANRNGVVHFLSSMNAIGLLLSRFAQDLQLWTTAESALAGLPDALCGGSSMMPQKRNPFLVEYIKSRATAPLGALASCSGTVGKTPYSNSFEIGAQINGYIADAHRAIEDVLTVTRALVEGIDADPGRVNAHLKQHALAATAVAEAVVHKHGVSFRTAYGRVRNAIRAAVEKSESVHDALAEFEPSLAARQPIDWAMSHAYGGGPGSATLADGVAGACNALAADIAALRRRRGQWREAAQMRAAIVAQVADGEGEPAPAGHADAGDVASPALPPGITVGISS